MPYYPPTSIPAHTTSHQSGGSDAIKLDDFAAPDDNTDLNASVSAHGLMQKYPNTKYEVLRGDGSFSNTLTREGVGVLNSFTLESFSDIFYNEYAFKKAKGSVAAPRRVKDIVLLGAINGFGSYAADDVSAATPESLATVSIALLGAGDHTATSQPTQVYFYTTPVGGTSGVPRWGIASDGALTPTAPAYLNVKLDDLIAPDDNTDLNASTSAHGLLKKLSGAATDFLDGSGAFDTVKDSDLSTSDITTNDATTSKHGFLQKLPGGTTTFLRADGAFASVTATAAPGWQRKPAADENLPANSSHTINRQYVIASGKKMTLASGAIMRIL